MNARAIASEHLMNPRELRLRERIDQLLDDRACLETKVADLQTRLKRQGGRARAALASRDHWRHRALTNHEHKLAQRRARYHAKQPVA